MLPVEDIEARLKQINETIPVHHMLDGFWVRDFQDGELVITCSFDRLAYRDYDIEFAGVIFFNTPSRWDDTNVPTDELLRLSDGAEFAGQQPDFDIGSKHVFALDLVYHPPEKSAVKHTFYIVADSVSVEKCLQGNAAPFAHYDDPFKGEAFPCTKNRAA